jgi:hypothetical protein
MMRCCWRDGVLCSRICGFFFVNGSIGIYVLRNMGICHEAVGDSNCLKHESGASGLTYCLVFAIFVLLCSCVFDVGFWER